MLVYIGHQQETYDQTQSKWTLEKHEWFSRTIILLSSTWSEREEVRK